MKRILKPGVSEQAEYICDFNGKPAYGKLVMTFEYGSKHDMEVFELDLSDEAADEILLFLRNKKPDIKPKQASFRGCPLCGRG